MNFDHFEILLQAYSLQEMLMNNVVAVNFGHVSTYEMLVRNLGAHEFTILEVCAAQRRTCVIASLGLCLAL